MKYITKRIIKDAIQWTGDNYGEVFEFIGDAEATCWYGEKLLIKTLEGEMIATKGCFIVKGIEGEFYPVKPEIFEAAYELYDSDVRF